MTRREDGGPAYPTHIGRAAEEAGMTLRDYFAGQALAWIMQREWKPPAAELARRAYEVADAMLAERSKP